MDPHLDDLTALLGSRRLAHDLLARTSISHLASASVDELTQLLPHRLAHRLHAGLRLGIAAIAPPRPANILTSAQGFAHVYPYLARQETERLVVVCLNAAHQPIHTEVVAQGSVNTVSSRAADIFAPALRHRATAILVAHCHPSGNAEPSDNDLAFTRDLLAACELMHVVLLDHLVVAGREYRSIRTALEQRGVLWRAAQAPQP